jgi:hypothetical protein
MKTGIYSILFLIAGLLSTGLSAQTCSKTIDSSSPYIDWQNSTFKDIQPGDTVCLQAGNWDYIQLKNFHGTAAKPIVFINSGGTVIINTDHFVGIKIGNCSHIVFTGNGDSQAPYGFRILKVSKGAGMGIDDYSTDIEVAHVEISNTLLGGVYAKTDPTCSNLGATRGKFVMRNFSFHDNYVHDVPEEGLYIGNSHYAGLHLTQVNATGDTTCDTTVYPHVLRGVFIYNNLVENTGWDGIQVSSADSNCQIHDNHINYDSQAGKTYQMSGILIGGGSVCKTYNNTISNGQGDGIDVFGMGNFNVFNNLIVDAGKYYLPGQPNMMKHGIYVGKVVTTANAILGIYNNTIVSPKSYGIVLSNNELNSILVKSNLIVSPGKLGDAGNSAYINIGNMDGARVDSSNNYNVSNVSTVRFINANAGNFDLQPSSPAVNYGNDLTAIGITFDILNRSRPFHGLFSAGAYESHDPSVGIRSKKALDIEMFKVYPNPAKGKVSLLIRATVQQEVRVVVTDIQGRIVLRKEIRCNPFENSLSRLSIRHLKSGEYFVVLFSSEGLSSRPLLIKK